MKRILFTLFIVVFSSGQLPAQTRWNIEPDGSIRWTPVKDDVHSDNIEMSGRHVSLIASYGVGENGNLQLTRKIVFPMLRTIPNDTHAHTMYTFGPESAPVVKINNRQLNEHVKRFNIKGILIIESTADNIIIKHELFPSTDKPAVIEKYTLKNTTDRKISVDVENFEKTTLSHPEKSVYGIYELSAKSVGSGLYTVNPGDSITFAVVFSGQVAGSTPLKIDVDGELAKRKGFVEQMFSTLKFVSPDPVLNRMFDFAKIRAMESIYETRGGLVHSPGGATYYAAIWANDQAEYANPFFAYTGYPAAIEAARVSWDWFAKYINPDYNPIPSSIIAEGTDFWNGAGDRGDQAMIAYGASRFALALGDRKTAEQIWPLVEWCIEYCKRKLNDQGVVESDSDELEGRFPAGSANLCTSSLFYDALISAAFLGRDLGKPSKQISGYRIMAKELKANIEKYFGARINGYDTYRYYDGNDVLRSWICIPLTVGIFDRFEGTTNALFSPELWTDQGLLTQAGTSTFWDRSTLYGLRGVFAAGAIDRGLKFFTDYSTRRLLGDHVPYAVEAWPEGNQRHLSAESALYCRVVTEGIFGLRPTGMRSFTVTPRLPANWEKMSLENIVAFGGKKINILVSKKEDKILLEVVSDGQVAKSVLTNNGAKIEIRL
ncbi:MAG TPA: hypothetical protein PLX08_05460 [Bacteroidales bacterium]|jgi:hypothetical protein|nr:hypothetical protein [Bacteroidales bacterium]